MSSMPPEYHREWRKTHPKAAAEATRRYRLAHPEKLKAYRDSRKDRTAELSRKSMLMKRYGLTVEEFNQLAVAQNNCCAICRVDRPGGRGRWHVDHNHDTGEVRGLLCWKCNQGLGYFRDNIKYLKQAINYLAVNQRRLTASRAGHHVKLSTN